MGKKRLPKSDLYGKPKNYPYYFRAWNKAGKPVFISGTFKKKRAAKEAAKDYCGTRLKHRVIDRRKK